MNNKEYYISIDCETLGPAAGLHSMVQFGAVFSDCTGKTVFEYSANIEELEGAERHPDTMKWWNEQELKNPGLWESMTKDQVTPKLAMERFNSAVRRFNVELNASPVVVGYPVTFDFGFLYYYLCRFVGKSIVGFSALDMKTMAMTLLGSSYKDAAKRQFPRSWFDPKLKHTHNALDDAKGQAFTFFAMLEQMKKL